MTVSLESSILDEPIVFDEVCEEPEGTIIRSVRPLIFTPGNLKTFWDKSRQFPTLFGQEVSEDFRKFINLILHEGPNGVEPNGLFWVIDDFVGVFYMTDVEIGVDAKVHYTFFDRRQRGRINITKRMLKYVMDRYSLRRATVEVPLFVHKYTLAFIEELGFVREGKKRLHTLYKDRWFDVAIYGILKEELKNVSDS